jgi:hypothetical protein
MEAQQVSSAAKPPESQKLLGVYSNFPGMQVSVFDGDAGDYLAMRAAQLAALASLMAMEGFEHQNTATKNNARWLLADLGNEINHLIPIALKEAANTTH